MYLKSGFTGISHRSDMPLLSPSILRSQATPERRCKCCTTSREHTRHSFRAQNNNHGHDQHSWPRVHRRCHRSHHPLATLQFAHLRACSVSSCDPQRRIFCTFRVGRLAVPWTYRRTPKAKSDGTDYSTARLPRCSDHRHSGLPLAHEGRQSPSGGSSGTCTECEHKTGARTPPAHKPLDPRVPYCA